MLLTMRFIATSGRTEYFNVRFCVFYRRIYRLKKWFSKGEHGFTLIELLVVISILGVLTAVAVPNVASLMNTGKTQAAAAELASVRVAVAATMGTTGVSSVEGAPLAFDSDTDAVIGGDSVGDFIAGGNEALHGAYSILATGEVEQTSYP